MKDGFLGCSESPISDDNAILNKQKSTQSRDCLILKLFRMTGKGKIYRKSNKNCQISLVREMAQSARGFYDEVTEGKILPTSLYKVGGLHVSSMVNEMQSAEDFLRNNLDCFAEASNDERMTMDLTTDEADLTRISKFARLTKKFNPLLTEARVNKTVKNLTSYRPNVLTTSNNISAHSPFTTHHSRKRCAFTLAEVLITLGIIGVVAAMTMPTLIQKHQQQVLITRLKKDYSIMSQALVTSYAENGEFKEWDLGTEYTKENLKRVVNKYFLPYFKVVRIVDDEENNNSYSSYGFTIGDGTTLLFSLDGGSAVGGGPEAIMIVADFKGKDPQYDRDFSRENFVLSLSANNPKLSFFSWGNTPYCQNCSREELINNATYGCNANNLRGKRFNCGALIQHDGWQIKDDYPW